MKAKTLVSLLALLGLLGGNVTAAPMGTAFTYQGRLTERGAPANGTYDLRLILYDAATNGTQWFQFVTNTGVAVSNGLFTTPVDFGANPFDGTARWLEIAVRTNGGGSFTSLEPRQQLTPTPYALFATNAGLAVNATTALGVAPDSVTLAGIANSNVTSVKIAAGQVVKSLNQLKDDVLLGAGTNITMAVNGNLITVSSPTWSLTGNSGTTPGAYFLGTTDNQPLELKVNGQRALRLEPTLNDGWHSNIVNVVGGSPANRVDSGVHGATIAGGGAGYFPDYPLVPSLNRVQADFGAVGGGVRNTIEAAADYSTISGGEYNTIQNNAWNSSIGGGVGNTIQTNAGSSTIGGGEENVAQLEAVASTIGGGLVNTIQHDARVCTIGGGYENSIGSYAEYSTISGGATNHVSADYSTVGGGANNYASGSGGGGICITIGGGIDNSSYASYSTIGGGEGNSILSSSWWGTIGGGCTNHIPNNAHCSTIGGGRLNTILLSGDCATIPGGRENAATNYAFAAGRRAKANHTGAFVWADSTDADFASTANNQFLIRAGGGVGINATSPESALHVQDPFSIGGSIRIGSNLATPATRILRFGDGDFCTIGENSAYDDVMRINAKRVGISRDATGYKLEVQGDALVAGTNFSSSGHSAQLNLGDANHYIRGVYAGGVRIGTFGATDGIMLQESTGNVGIGTTSPTAKLSVNGNANNTTGVWGVYSDRRLKEHIEPMPSGSLERLLRLQGVTFDYTKPELGEGYTGVRRGWIAQDVEEVFPEWVTEDQTGTKMVTPVGINALTVEALRELRAEKDTELKARDAEIANLKARLEKLERLLAQNSKGGQ